MRDGGLRGGGLVEQRSLTAWKAIYCLYALAVLAFWSAERAVHGCMNIVFRDTLEDPALSRDPEHEQVRGIV